MCVRCTFDTQRSSALELRTALPLVSLSNWTFPRCRTLAMIPNRCYRHTDVTFTNTHIEHIMLFFCFVLILTSISLRLKCMTERAFFTDFQSFLSLMELTLAHSPCRSAATMQRSERWHYVNTFHCKSLVYKTKCVRPVAGSCSDVCLCRDPVVSAGHRLLPPAAGRRCGNFSRRGSGGPRVISPADSWGYDLQLHPPTTRKDRALTLRN